MSENNTKNGNIAKRVHRKIEDKIKRLAVTGAFVGFVGAGIGYHVAGSDLSDAKNEVKMEVPTKTEEKRQTDFIERTDENAPEMKQLKLHRAVLKRDLSEFKSVAPKEFGLSVFLLDHLLPSFDMLNETDAKFMLEAMKVALKDCSKSDASSLSLICNVKEKIRQDVKSNNDQGVEKFCENQERPYLGKLFHFCKNRVSASREKQLELEAKDRYNKQLKEKIEKDSLEKERERTVVAERDKKQSEANQYGNQSREQNKKKNWVPVKACMTLLHR